MMNKTVLIGLMLVLGAMPLAVVNALPFIHENGCGATDDIHYYSATAGITLWESKKDDLVIFGFGIVDVEDTCDPTFTFTDGDFEWGIGGANLPVLTVPACRTVIGHHALDYYVHDLLGEFGFRDVVSGDTGADGTLPCGDGLIAPGLDPLDCLAPFWGKGPHTACGVGADGSYWVFVNIFTVDLNEPRVGAGFSGCIWTEPFGKTPKPCDKING